MPVMLAVWPWVSYLPLGSAISSSSHGEGQPYSAGPVPLGACPALGPARGKLGSGSNVGRLPNSVVLVWTQRHELSCEVRSVCHW